MASERVQQARTALYNREAPHEYEAYREHIAQLDEFEVAVRTEAVAEWREAVEEFVAAVDRAGYVMLGPSVTSLARLRALLEDSQEEGE